MKIKILPSLLASDIGHLADGVLLAQDAGADGLHIDIMDPHFVPNISMGPAVVEMAKRVASIPLSVHLMLSRPDQFISNFIDAGADSLLIHVEAECNIPEQLDRIRHAGIRSGITLNPETPAEMILSVMDRVDEVLCMSVHPGYGGQAFIPDVLPKIETIRRFALSRGMEETDILVDGGINVATGKQVSMRGANVLIAGTSLYSGEGTMTDRVTRMRTEAQQCFMASIS